MAKADKPPAEDEAEEEIELEEADDSPATPKIDKELFNINNYLGTDGVLRS